MPDLTPQMERELAELEAELGPVMRETRPAPHDDWVRRMDRLMAAEFRIDAVPRARRGRRWMHLLLSGPAFATAAAALLVALVIALPGGDSGDEAGGGGGSVATEESGGSTAMEGGTSAESPGGGGAAADSSAGAARSSEESAAAPQALGGDTPDSSIAPIAPPSEGEGSPGSDGREGRKVERSAAISLAARPRNIDPVARRVSDLADAQGGFVVSSDVASSRSGGGGTIVLRVPERNLDATMAALARLGSVRDRAERTEDITAQAVSAHDRLQDARAERRALLRQLEDAVTLQAAAAIRARLRDVSAEIEAARAGLRRVNNRAAFATVTVTLVADAAAAPAGEDQDDGVWGPGDAADDALRVLEVVAGVALVALAVLFPIALVLLAVWLTARWGARRGRERALDAA